MTWDEVMREAEDVAADMARDAVEYGRQLLDTPAPPSSEPGEVPHRRTGNLRDSAYADVINEGETLTVKYGVGASYAPHLIASGRIILEPVQEFIEAEFRSRLQALFT